MIVSCITSITTYLCALYILTDRIRRIGRVMYSQVFVCPQMPWEDSPPPPEGRSPTPLHPKTDPGQDPGSGSGYCCGIRSTSRRYVSYWNAYLLSYSKSKEYEYWRVYWIILMFLCKAFRNIWSLSHEVNGRETSSLQCHRHIFCQKHIGFSSVESFKRNQSPTWLTWKIHLCLTLGPSPRNVISWNWQYKQKKINTTPVFL